MEYDRGPLDGFSRQDRLMVNREPLDCLGPEWIGIDGRDLDPGACQVLTEVQADEATPAHDADATEPGEIGRLYQESRRHALMVAAGGFSGTNRTEP